MQVEEVLLDVGPQRRCGRLRRSRSCGLLRRLVGAVDPHARLAVLGRVAGDSAADELAMPELRGEDPDECHRLAHAGRAPGAAAAQQAGDALRVPDRGLGEPGRGERVLDPPGRLRAEEGRDLGRAVGLLRPLRRSRRAAPSRRSAAAPPSRASRPACPSRRDARSARTRGGRGTGSGPRRRAPSPPGRPGPRGGTARGASRPRARRRARGGSSGRTPAGAPSEDGRAPPSTRLGRDLRAVEGLDGRGRLHAREVRAELRVVGPGLEQEAAPRGPAARAARAEVRVELVEQLARRAPAPARGARAGRPP